MKNIPLYVVALFIIFVGVKSCVVSLITIEQPVVAQIKDDQGQINTIFVTNGRVTLSSDWQQRSNMKVYRMAGNEASHYFAGLYKVESPSFWLGFRYYPKAEDVIECELKLIWEDGNFVDDTNNTYRTLIVINKNNVIIGESTYARLDDDSIEYSERIAASHRCIELSKNK